MISLLSSAIVPASTFYRHFANYASTAQSKIKDQLADDVYPRLHWVDNFAKYYATNALWVGKKPFLECLWTAHGYKRLSSPCDLSWHRDQYGDSIPAMPHLDELLTEEHFRSLLMKFTELAHPYLMESVSYTRDVRRIPLKYDQPTDEKEQIHLQSSYDGLRLFVPVNIHAANISTIDGLMNVVHILQDLEGFGSHEHRRHGKYSLLHVDCKIYWQLLRMLYSFPGLVGMRHDLFLVFGFWHAYHYANIALWHEFRYTFLGPAYFTIFPDQKLLHRPKLTQSATFFMWLRLAYPDFKEQYRGV